MPGSRGCGRTRRCGHCCGREPGQGDDSCPTSAVPSRACWQAAARGPSLIPTPADARPHAFAPWPPAAWALFTRTRGRACKPKHRHTHMHVISQPPPTTTGPSVCRFPREELGVQHMWAPSHGGAPKSPHVGGPSSLHTHGWGYLLPCLAQGWCPAYCSSWGFAKVGAGKSWRHVPEPQQQHPCSCASRKEDIWVSLPPRHATTPCLGSSGPHRPWAGSTLLLGSIAALPASQQAGGTAGRSPLQGLPLQVPASPSVGEILTSSCPRLG